MEFDCCPRCKSLYISQETIGSEYTKTERYFCKNCGELTYGETNDKIYPAGSGNKFLRKASV